MRIGDSGSASVAAQYTSNTNPVEDDGQVAVADMPAVNADTLAPGAQASPVLAQMARDGTAAAVLSRGTAPVPPSLPAVDGYKTGQPQAPNVQWDDDFAYNTQSATFADYRAAAEWQAKLAGAQLLRPDLDDATRAYAHYWGNTGASLEIDYAKAYREDAVVRSNTDGEIARTAAAVDAMAGTSGATSFSVTGQAHGAQQAGTENWQKTIGAYQQWSSADVTVSGNQVTMTVTVHALDRYNFNRGQSDIASGAPDNANGRFTELGWAKPFNTHGEITRTVSWTLGQPPSAAVVASQAGRN